jgi:hypothetical protein
MCQQIDERFVACSSRQPVHDPPLDVVGRRTQQAELRRPFDQPGLAAINPHPAGIHDTRQRLARLRQHVVDGRLPAAAGAPRGFEVGVPDARKSRDDQLVGQSVHAWPI